MAHERIGLIDMPRTVQSWPLSNRTMSGTSKPQLNFPTILPGLLADILDSLQRCVCISGREVSLSVQSLVALPEGPPVGGRSR